MAQIHDHLTDSTIAYSTQGGTFDNHPPSFGNRKDQRQWEADQRRLQREKRSDVQQIERLIHYGHGHCKEVKRLRERIEILAKVGKKTSKSTLKRLNIQKKETN